MFSGVGHAVDLSSVTETRLAICLLEMANLRL